MVKTALFGCPADIVGAQIRIGVAWVPQTNYILRPTFSCLGIEPLSFLVSSLQFSRSFATLWFYFLKVIHS